MSLDQLPFQPPCQASAQAAQIPITTRPAPLPSSSGPSSIIPSAQLSLSLEPQANSNGGWCCHSMSSYEFVGLTGAVKALMQHEGDVLHACAWP